MTAAQAAVGGTRPSAVRELLTGIGTIMTKELRSRMRGRRAFIVLTVYLGILALLTYGVYAVVAPNARTMGAPGLADAHASALIGQSVFTALSIFQLVLVCFIAPAFTAGQISLEREKQTLDLLVSTPLRPTAIVLGKLVAALASVVRMIVAALPIVAIVLMYGGATVGDLVRQQVVLLATALILGAIGLFYSALLKRTQAATVLTYITMLAMTLGTALVFVFLFATMANSAEATLGRPRIPPEQILYPNPGIAMLDVIAPAEPGGGSGTASFLAGLRGSSFMDGDVGQCLGGECQPNDVPRNPFGDTSGYWWTRIVITYVLVAAALTFAATRLVVPAGMRWAFRRSRRDPARAAGVGAGDAPVTGEGAAIEELEP